MEGNRERKQYGRNRAGRGNGPAANHQGYKPGSIPELPVLRYGRNSNYEEFKRKITLYAEREYKQLASFFRTNAYFEVPALEGTFDPEELLAENDPFGIVRAQLIEETRLRVRLVNQMNNDKPALFAVIWGQLSAESEQVVMQHAQWNVISRRDDPLVLWRAIRDTHVVNAVGQAGVDRMIARDQYNKLRQGPNESLAAFKERTDEAIRALESYGVAVPRQEDLASDFINRLDKTRYASFQAELMNGVTIANVQYPNTLVDAFNKASRYRVVHTNQKAKGGEVFVQSVFIGAADQPVKHNNNKRNNNKHQKKGDQADKTSGDANNDKNKQKKNKKEHTGCYICGSLEHWARFCPSLEQCREHIRNNQQVNMHNHEEVEEPRLDFVNMAMDEVVVHASSEVSSRQSTLGAFDVLLDNQATKGVFHNTKLLSNIRKDSVITRFTGLGGAVECDAVADVRDFGVVSYFPQSVANILSFAEVADKHKIEYDHDRGFIVFGDENIYVFERKGNLFVCNFAKYFDNQQIMITTVAENELLYTRREVEDAKKARQLMKELGYPSEASMIELINTGSILNCPVTAHDVHRASKIWGNDVPSMKGKQKLVKSNPVKVEFVPRPVVSLLVLHIDLMMVETELFLISVSTPLGLTLVTHLPNGKGAKALWKALQDQIYTYKAENFTIGSILTDGEPAVIANRQEIQKIGIRLDPTGPGQHVPVAESKIRVVKERVRAIASSLPFLMTRLILRYLVFYATQKINMMPSSAKLGARVSPFEAYRGRKLDYNRDVRISFGEYVQATRVNIVNRNDLTPRTDGAIALLPTCNRQGTVKFFALTTGEVISRDRWKVLPMPNEVIEYLNNLAKAERKGLTLRKEPTFQFGKNMEVIDDNTEEEEEEQVISEQFDPPTKIMGDGLGDDVNCEPDLMNQLKESESEEIEEEDSSLPQGETVAEEEEVQQVPLVSHGRNTRSQKTYGKDDRTWEYGLNFTAKEAKRRFGEEETIRVAKLEMQQMIDLDVFEPVNKDSEEYKWLKMIRCFMFYKDKYDAMGEFEKLKARFVANDSNNDMTVYADKSSPTVSLTSVLIVTSIAARERRKVIVVDIAGAYLNALLKNKIVLMYVEPELAKILVELKPELYRPFVRKDGSIVVRLKKALYGCVESAKLWYDHLSSGLKEIGYCVNKLDACVLNKKGKKGNQCTVCIYVDDLMISCQDQEDIDEVIQHLKDRYKTIKIKDEKVISYLGMIFDFSDDGQVKVSMDGYVQDILKGYDVVGNAVTPATTDLFDIDKDNTPLSLTEKDIFHSRVAKLLYMAKRVRPDILLACSFLASRVNCSTEGDMKKLNRVLKYLNCTPKASIVLGLGGDSLELTAYIDASYGIHSDGKGQTGCLITLGNEGPVYARSSKQKLVAKSSAEAELIGVSDEYSQVIWCRDFLINQGYNMKAAKVYQDNKSTIEMVKKGSHAGRRSRHIHVRYFFVKDRVDSGEIEVEYLPTANMKSDMLTKPLQGELFREMRGKSLVVDE